jgi:hypothetical protein
MYHTVKEFLLKEHLMMTIYGGKCCESKREKRENK